MRASLAFGSGLCLAILARVFWSAGNSPQQGANEAAVLMAKAQPKRGSLGHEPVARSKSERRLAEAHTGAEAQDLTFPLRTPEALWSASCRPLGAKSLKTLQKTVKDTLLLTLGTQNFSEGLTASMGRFEKSGDYLQLTLSLSATRGPLGENLYDFRLLKALSVEAKDGFTPVDLPTQGPTQALPLAEAASRWDEIVAEIENRHGYLRIEERSRAFVAPGSQSMSEFANGQLVDLGGPGFHCAWTAEQKTLACDCLGGFND